MKYNGRVVAGVFFLILFNIINPMGRRVSAVKCLMDLRSLENEIEGFLPKNARLINIDNPKGGDAVQLKDIDGDGQEEVIATYRLMGAWHAVGLIVLRNTDSGTMEKILDYTVDGYSINYLKITDITGEGKADIVIGWNTGTRLNKLNILCCENGNIKRVSGSSYSWIEVEDMQNNRKEKDGVGEIAVWRKTEGEAYDIEVMKWNGIKLETAKEMYIYYFKKVISYYEKKVKEMPDRPLYWYYLADSQLKAGRIKEAKLSIEEGLRNKRNSGDTFPETRRFQLLKDQIKELSY